MVINARKQAFSVVPKASPWRWKSCAHMCSTSLWGVAAKWLVAIGWPTWKKFQFESPRMKLRLGFCFGFSCFVSFIWCQLFAWLIARYTNGRDWGAASKSARLNYTNLTHFRLTAGRFRGNSCIVCFRLLVSCYSLLRYSRPAWLELFVDHTHTHSMSNLRWQPHWLPRLTSLPRKSRDWWRTRDSSLGQPTENKID